MRCRWRISIASRSIEEAITRERRKEHRVAVARNDLGRDRLGREAERLRDVGFDPRIDVGEGADGTRDRAGRDLLARVLQPLPGARELGVGLCQLQTEGDRLGMDAVAAADGWCHLVLEGARLERRQQAVDVGEQEVRGARPAAR